jgi:hypothetical protein
MYALSNWGEKDPIIEAANVLKHSKDKADWSTSKKLTPKKRCFAQVVVRGKENEGTKLWEFGTQVEEQLLRLFNDEDYGDISDIETGRDLTVEGFPATFPGKDGKDVSFIKPTITPRVKSTPLADSPELVKSLMETQNDPLGLYKKWSFDELFDFVQEWLKPSKSEEEQTEVTTEDSGELPDDEETVVEDKPKRSKRDEVDRMFSNKK